MKLQSVLLLLLPPEAFLCIPLLVQTGLLDGSLHIWVVAPERLVVFVNGGEAAAQTEAAPQGHEQRLRDGEDVHVVAHVDPGQAGEPFRVLHHLRQVLQDGGRQAVAIDGQRGEFGQAAEAGQQQAQTLVLQLGEAQVHRRDRVQAVLKVEGHTVDVTSRQRDSRQVHHITGKLLLQGGLQTV